LISCLYFHFLISFDCYTNAGSVGRNEKIKAVPAERSGAVLPPIAPFIGAAQGKDKEDK
jgi:hypothetical protein